MIRLADRLKRSWHRVRTVPGLGRNVVAISVVLALGTSAGAYILSQQQAHWPWQDEFTFSAEFAAAPGISPGNGQEVRIAGVSVGEIRDAEVTDHGTARLTLVVSSGDIVYDNARVVLRPKSPLNEMYVTIEPGAPPGRPLPEDGLIPQPHTSTPVQPDEVLSHLNERSRDALRSVLAQSDSALAHAPTQLPGGLREADRTMVGLRPVAEALQARQDKIRSLATALGEIAAVVGTHDTRLAQIASSLQRTLSSVQAHAGEVDSVLQQLPGFTSELRRATQNTSNLTGQLNPTLDNLDRASRELPGALSRLGGTVERVDSTVDHARPVVAGARPLFADLRPLVDNVGSSLDDLHQSTGRLDTVTERLLPYLQDVKAFMDHTASAASMHDANGGFVRAHAVVAPESVPFLPGFLRGNPR